MNKRYYLLLILLFIISTVLMGILIIRAYQTDLFFARKSAEEKQENFMPN
jgi:hypothetical protein